MIEHLTVGRAAYFYSRKRPLSKTAIDDLFRTLRTQATAPTHPLFRIVKEEIGDAVYSAICFSYEKAVPFLNAEADKADRVFGFLMVIEKGDYVAILKSGIDLPSKFKTQFLVRLANDRIERAIAREDAIFEKLRLKNMSTSKFALRSKSFEANDLENSIPTASANRFVAQGYHVRLPDGRYSAATPSTGRISERADRANHEELVTWASSIIDLLMIDEAPVAPFLRNFARPINLDSIPLGVEPTYIAIDVAYLGESLLEEPASLRLVVDHNGTPTELTRDEIDEVLLALNESFPIRSRDVGKQICRNDGEEGIGWIGLGKTRIGLDLTLPPLNGVCVEDRQFELGTDPDAMPLIRYIDRKNWFTVLFSDVTLAYVEGGLFRDMALIDGGTEFLRHLVPWPELATATSEKGTFAAEQGSFSADSVFNIVVDRTINDCNVLICDDLNDEWADFIGLSTNNAGPQTVNFYHAKHGRLSLGASPFHVAVSQAMKNLGRMALAADAMPAKYQSWASPYRNDEVETAISRHVRGGTEAEIEAAFSSARVAPNLVKQVFIVTSSLSRNAVSQAFTNAANGRRPSAHFIQLYWLLSTYFAACAEMGATGYVVCQT